MLSSKEEDSEKRGSFALKRILDDIGKGEYKKKLLLFSKRIDHWHKEQSKLNSGVFEEDRDFVELDRSPSKFTNLPTNHDSIDEFLLDQQSEARTSHKQEVEEEEKKEGAEQLNGKQRKRSNTNSFSKKRTQIISSRQSARKTFLKNKTKVLTLKLREMSPIKADEEEDAENNASHESKSAKKKLSVGHSSASCGRSVPKHSNQDSSLTPLKTG